MSPRGHFGFLSDGIIEKKGGKTWGLLQHFSGRGESSQQEDGPRTRRRGKQERGSGISIRPQERGRERRGGTVRQIGSLELGRERQGKKKSNSHSKVGKWRES